MLQIKPIASLIGNIVEAGPSCSKHRGESLRFGILNSRFLCFKCCLEDSKCSSNCKPFFEIKEMCRSCQRSLIVMFHSISLWDLMSGDKQAMNENDAAYYKQELEKKISLKMREMENSRSEIHYTSFRFKEYKDLGSILQNEESKHRFVLECKEDTVNLKLIYEQILIALKLSPTPLGRLTAASESNERQLVIFYENQNADVNEVYMLDENNDITIEIKRLREGLIKVFFVPEENAFLIAAINQSNEIFDLCGKILNEVQEIRKKYDIKETRKKFTKNYELFAMMKSKLMSEKGYTDEEFDKEVSRLQNEDTIFESLKRAEINGRPTECSDWTSVCVFKIQKEKYCEVLKIHEKVELANTLMLTIMDKFETLLKGDKKMLLEKHNVQEQIDVLRGQILKKFLVKTETRSNEDELKELGSLIGRILELNQKRLQTLLKTLREKLFEINKKMKENSQFEEETLSKDPALLDLSYEKMGREFKEYLFSLREELKRSEEEEIRSSKVFFENLENKLSKMPNDSDIILDNAKRKANELTQAQELALCILYKSLGKKKISIALRLLEKGSEEDIRLHKTCLKILSGGDLLRKTYVAHVDPKSEDHSKEKTQIRLATLFGKKMDVQRKHIIIYHQEGCKYYFDIFINNRFNKINNLKEVNASLNDPEALKITSITEENILNSIKLVQSELFCSRGDLDYRKIDKNVPPEFSEINRGGIEYWTPKDWVRVGLNVSKWYGEDDHWLTSVHNSEWSVGYLTINQKSIWRSLMNDSFDKELKENLIQVEKVPEILKNYPGGIILIRKIHEKQGNIAVGTGVKIGPHTFNIAFQCKVKAKKELLTQDVLVAEKSSDIRSYGILIKKK